MKKALPFLFASISGFLIISSWIVPIPGIFILASYVPLLLAEHLLTNEGNHKRIKVFLAAFLCFFIANFLGIGWLQKLVSGWAILFFLYNAGLASIVFLLFSIVKQKLGKNWGYVSFIVFTVAFEFLSLNVNFSFPCLFAGILIFGSDNASLVQWYEYTGVLGGSVWVLLSNVLIFLLLKKWIEKERINQYRKLIIATLSCILLPIVFSLIKYYTYNEIENPVEVVVVQPNIDPYTEKFTKSQNDQLDIMLNLAKECITEKTEYVIFPETALDSNLWLNNINENYMVLKIKESLLNDYPQTKVITGLDMMQYYIVHNQQPPTTSAKKVDEKIYFDFFNAAMQIDAKHKVQVYKKSKLVLGTEYVPFAQHFPSMEKWIINLGGSAQSRGRQDIPSLMSSYTTSVATAICYESLYGEYLTKFVNMGADFICLISNDGWWDGTPAPLQHYRFAQLRAIENRRSVVRCANTGLSGFVNQRGDIVQISEWWKPLSMKQEINKNKQLTFYSRHGDYIGWICAGTSGIILFLFAYKILSTHRKKTGSSTKKRK